MIMGVGTMFSGGGNSGFSRDGPVVVKFHLTHFESEKTTILC